MVIRACVLGGGGCRGAFQVGVIHELARLDPDIDYDVFAGISVGALSAAFLCQSPRGHLAEWADALLDMWMSIRSSADIWKHWFPFRELEGLLYKGSFYDAKPLADKIKGMVSDGAAALTGRKLRIGCVSRETGEYVEATEETFELWKWVYASAAYPVFFSPIEIDGTLYVDGGARRVTPLKAAIAAGATDCDIIVTSPKGEKPIRPGTTPALGGDALRVAARTAELMSIELFERDLMLCELHNKMVACGHAGSKRTVKIETFHPIDCLSDNPLKFDPDEIRSAIAHGRDVARSIVARRSHDRSEERDT